MTPSTLLFLRQLCDRLTVASNDPDFRTITAQIIAAQDELDKEIANADNP